MILIEYGILHQTPTIVLSGKTLAFDLSASAFEFDQSQIFLLTVAQTSPGFYVSAVRFFRKHGCKRRNCS